ncbi:MAG: PKD domain-containing protein [Acidimicrobiales bacterium]
MPLSAISTGAKAVVTSCSSATTCSLTPVNVGSGTLGTPIKLPEEGYDVALTPTGSTAFVTGGGGGDHVVPVSLGTAKAGKVIPTAESSSIAVAPNGATAYTIAGSGLVPINTATGAQGASFTGETTELAGGLAVAPNGQTVYAYELNDGVLPFSASTGTADTAIPVGSGYLDSFAITPDGSTLYATQSSADEVYPVDLTTTTAEAGISVPNAPQSVAVSPDGKTVLTANSDGTVTTIAVSTNTVESTVAVCPGSAADAQAVTIAPDDATALVICNGSNASDVVPYTIGSATAGNPISTGTQFLNDIAIVPDQSPVASLKAFPGLPGTASSFDASTSAADQYSIDTYSWTFGDGATATTTTPTTTHTYATTGNYSASVTETDSVGASTTEVYTGQTATTNGRSVSKATTALSIASTACAAGQLCKTEVQSPTSDVTAAGTSSDNDASLAAAIGAGTLSCATKGFSELGDLIQIEMSAFAGQPDVNVLDQVVTAVNKALVCYQGPNGPAASLPKCSAKAAAPCVSSAAKTAAAINYSLKLPADDGTSQIQVENTAPTNLKSAKPTKAEPGKSVTVKGSGFPALDKISFAFTGQGGVLVQSPTLSSTVKEAIAAVPADAVTGPIYLELNGELATSIKSLTVK